MLQHIIQDAVTLFVIIDPLALVPIFITITLHQDAQTKQKTALRAALISAVILSGFLVFGQFLLKALEVSLPAFEIGGGLVLLIIGLKMILENTDAAATENLNGDVAVFPLAMPFIAGPGAIMTVVLLTDNAKFSISEQAITAATMLSILGFTYWIMIQSQRIQKILGATGANAITRVVGLLVVAIAIETMLSGIKSFFGIT